MSAVAVLLISGCGYRFTSNDLVVPLDKSLHVGMFTNRTYQANADGELRQAFVSTLASRGVKVGDELSDYSLTGEILTMSAGASAFSSVDTARFYTITLTVQAVLTDRRSNKVIWKGDEVVRQGYPANSDLALQRNAHDAAVSAACVNAARILTTRMNQAF